MIVILPYSQQQLHKRKLCCLKIFTLLFRFFFVRLVPLPHNDGHWYSAWTGTQTIRTHFAFLCFCSWCCWCCCGAIYIVPWLLKTRPPTDFLACCFPIFPFFLRSLRNFHRTARSIAAVGELQVLLKPCPQLVKNKQAKKEASRRAYGTLLTANDSAFVRCTFVMIFALFCPVRKTATLLFL